MKIKTDFVLTVGEKETVRKMLKLLEEIGDNAYERFNEKFDYIELEDAIELCEDLYKEDEVDNEENEEDEQCIREYNDGYSVGYEDGYKDGYEDGERRGRSKNEEDK